MSANAATWTVTKAANSDDNVCDADCSLREAVFNADSGDTVAFSPGLVGQTIKLGGSQIVITKRIIIDGFINDPNVAFISGEMTSRIFYIQPGGGLDLRNAILVQGNGNDSNFGDGGAIYAADNASLSLDRVAVRGNSTHFYGAILLGTGTHHITNSSLTGNNAASCSAIGNQGGNLYMANVTVSGNFRSGVGGVGSTICNQGDMFIRNSTIANNTSNGAGAIFNTAQGDINIGNSIVAQNTGMPGNDFNFVNGTLTSVGGNSIGDLSTVPANTFNKPNDLTGVNPLLAPTNSNQGGHPVITHPLQAGSPARNQGLNANAVDPLTNQPLTTDARGAGFPRIAAGTVDIGAFEDQSGNTSLIVTKLADTNDLVCDTDCSLREAVHTAGLNFGTDTITFAANVFGTITLGGTEILIQNQNVNIVGYPNLKSNVLTVSGANTSRIFRLNNATANISGMTLSGGEAGVPNGLGGAIYGDSSNLSLNRVIITDNDANAYAAFYMTGGSTQRIINSTISGNSAKNSPGIGIANTSLFMSNTTISGNFDSDGGAGLGALLCMSGALNIRNSTIAFNRVAAGTNAGIQLSGCALNIGNSIVAQNLASANPDIQLSSGSITSVGGNLIGSTNGFPAGTFNQTNDAVGVDAMLNPLADNGGIVPTLSLKPSSSAINSGLNANVFDPFDNSLLTTDARGGGYERIVGGTVDKGAFESLAPTAAGATVSGRVMNGKRGVAKARVYLTGQNGETRTAMTNSFGYFGFSDIQAGQSYIANVSSKSYTFLPQVITVNEDLDDLNFSPESSGIGLNNNRK